MSFQTKEGYLLKYRNKLAGWENRYFKLDRSYLHYFESKDSHQPKKSVLRTNINGVGLSSNSPDRPNVLDIFFKSSSDKSWLVQFQSEFEMKEWSKALLAHIPDYDLRRPQWLSEKPVEPPPLEAPPMPQYMMMPDAPIGPDPPSYNTASQYYQGHTPHGHTPTVPYNTDN